ncbi:MAG: TetR/AcrR family transcriptional regulator [Brevinema sp.]
MNKKVLSLDKITSRVETSPQKDNGTQQKILKTAVDIILKQGIQGLTVRKVATNANVNVASINYHFKSKDGLIESCVIHIIEPLLKIIQEINISNISPRQKMGQILHKMGNYFELIPLPLIISLATNIGASLQNEQWLSIRRGLLFSIITLVKELRPSDSEETLFITSSQIFAAAIMPRVLMPLHKNLLDTASLTVPSLDHHLDILLDNFFGKERK